MRPTSDKARGAVFNILHSQGGVEHAHVIDCFCGTGALGLEALSRGAARCVFIDNDKKSLALAQENAAALGVAGEGVFLCKNAARLSLRPDEIPSATLVFLDPPYGQDLLAPALRGLHRGSWLAEGAVCVAETEKNGVLPPPSFAAFDERLYGRSKILFLRYRPSG